MGHRRVVGQHDRREAPDALLAGPVGEPAQERGADPAPLPVVGDREGDLGAVGPRVVADEPRDADAIVGARVERHERLVIAMVDLGEIAQVARAEARMRAEEAAVARLVAQAVEAGRERRLVVGLDRPDA